MKSLISTPCIGICSTAIGDTVCRGCKRFQHEVIDWNSYSATQKQLILQRLDHLLAPLVASKIEIVDTSVLRQQIEYQKLRIDLTREPPCWVYELLRLGGNQIADLSLYGLRLLPEYVGVPAKQIWQDIDREFFILSEAHLQRYVLANR